MKVMSVYYRLKLRLCFVVITVIMVIMVGIMVIMVGNYLHYVGGW